jgi:hypothetical protein
MAIKPKKPPPDPAGRHQKLAIARLKTLKGLTPFEHICKSWTSQPERFILNPLQQMPGLLYSAA